MGYKVPELSKAKVSRCKVCGENFVRCAIGHKTCSQGCKLVMLSKKHEKTVQKAIRSKKTSLPTLQAKADKAMSVYIRLKYADHAGNVSCVSCGKVVPWKESDCGHFIPRSRGASIRYVEENCHPECQGCNRFSHSHLIGYTLYMIDTYGREKIEELEQEARKVLSPSQKRQLAEEALAYYRQAAEKL